MDCLYFLFIINNFICFFYVMICELCYMYLGYYFFISFGKFKECVLVYFYDDELKILKIGKIVKWCVVGIKIF